jgi:Planctomycete cytochrome C/WD domain, G-beta repeat
MPRQTSFSPIVVAASFALVFASLLTAADTSNAPVSFRRDIAPILQAKCLTCHNAEKSKGGYRLHTFAELMKAGDSKELPVVAGSTTRSKLHQLLIAKDDDRMPQKDDPLPAAQVSLITRWIEHGATFDGQDANAQISSFAPPQTHPAAPGKYLRPVPILALEFTTDGTALFAGGYHEITIWNATNGALLRRVGNLPQQIHALAFSPSSNLLAVCGGTAGRSGEVLLLNPDSGKILRSLATSSDVFLCLAFSPDGRQLLAAGADNSIRVFDIASGRELRRVEQHADWVMSLAFAPDGKHFASASRDKTARLFSTASAELEETYDGHGQPVFAVGFSRNGKRVLSGARDREIHAWSTNDAKKVFELSGFGGDVLRFLTHEDQLFSVATDRVVRQHRLADKGGEFLRAFPAHRDSVYSLALHAATGRIASGGHDGTVRLHDIESGKLLIEFIAAPGWR